MKLFTEKIQRNHYLEEIGGEILRNST